MPLPPSTAVILFAMCFAAMLSVSAPVPTGPLPAFVDELDEIVYAAALARFDADLTDALGALEL